jgi:hypothetical protein
VFKK